MSLPGLTEPRVFCYVDTDARQVADFFGECSALDSTIETLSVDRWRAFTRQSYNRDARDFAVVRQQTRILGTLTSTLLATTDLPLRHFRIIVHPDERRRGIGTLLLEQVERQDRGREVGQQCNCLASWGAGREFLRRSSFQVARRHRPGGG